jgi:hypothetical protein
MSAPTLTPLTENAFCHIAELIDHARRMEREREALAEALRQLLSWAEYNARPPRAGTAAGDAILNARAALASLTKE